MRKLTVCIAALVGVSCGIADGAAARPKAAGAEPGQVEVAGDARAVPRVGEGGRGVPLRHAIEQIVPPEYSINLPNAGAWADVPVTWHGHVPFVAALREALSATPDLSADVDLKLRLVTVRTSGRPMADDGAFAMKHVWGAPGATTATYAGNAPNTVAMAAPIASPVVAAPAVTRVAAQPPQVAATAPLAAPIAPAVAPIAAPIAANVVPHSATTSMSTSTSTSTSTSSVAQPTGIPPKITDGAAVPAVVPAPAASPAASSSTAATPPAPPVAASSSARTTTTRQIAQPTRAPDVEVDPPASSTSTVASAPPAPSAPPVPPPEPVRTWQLALADHTVKNALTRWAKDGGWQLIWDVPIDFGVDADATITGTFEQALQSVVHALEKSDTPIQAVLYKGNKVLRIVAKGAA